MRTDWKKYEELMLNKIQNYDWNTKNSTEYTEKCTQYLLLKTATKSIGKYKISNNILINQ